MLKEIIKIKLIVFVLLILCTTAYAQYKSGKVKVSLSPIPNVMIAGQSYDVVLTVRNDSRKTWYSDELTASSGEHFRIEKITSGLTVKHGRTAEVIFRITSPTVADIYHFGFHLNYNDKTVLTRMEIIEVLR